MPRTTSSRRPRIAAIWASEKPCRLASRRVRHVELVGRGDLLGHLVDQEQLVDEPRVDPGRVEDLVGRRAGPDRLHDLLQAAVVRACGSARSSPSRSSPTGEWKSNGACLSSRLRRAFCSASVKLRPIAIASPTDFMCVVSVGSAPGNFSKANRGTFTTT